MTMTRMTALLLLASFAFVAAAKTSTGSRLVHRKQLQQASCGKDDISIAQTQDAEGGGIPKFMVEIVNNCVSDCAPSNIHFHCGWFSSDNLIDPNVFKRIAYDDCLVNGGEPLKKGAVLSFYYTTSFMDTLTFKSASFC